MIVTLHLPPAMETQLRHLADQGDLDGMRRLLAEAAMPAVEAMLREQSRELSAEEFEALADEMADIVDAHRDPNAPPLSDYAVSGEGIYGDHL